MQELTQVAKRNGDGKLIWQTWRELPSLLYIKKLYKEKPGKFAEIDGILYHKQVPKRAVERIRELLVSSLKISGSRYALALNLAGGDRNSINFRRYYEKINDNRFIDRLQWIEMLENYIKNNAVAVGTESDGRTVWLYQSETMGVSLQHVKTLFSQKPENFEKIGKIIYFLPTHNILVENMFFRCVEIAGSEHKLARAISVDQKSYERHIKNFERMSFKHRENFKCYSIHFSRFLKNHHSLPGFEEEVIDV